MVNFDKDEELLQKEGMCSLQMCSLNLKFSSIIKSVKEILKIHSRFSSTLSDPSSYSFHNEFKTHIVR